RHPDPARARALPGLGRRKLADRNRGSVVPPMSRAGSSDLQRQTLPRRGPQPPGGSLWRPSTKTRERNPMPNPSNQPTTNNSDTARYQRGLDAYASQFRITREQVPGYFADA